MPREPRNIHNTDISLHRISDAKYRAKKKQLEFNLTPEWYINKIETGICEATGLSFTNYGEDGRARGPFGPSIDRIDPTKGYTTDNSRIVCNIYNYAKYLYTDYDVYIMSKAFIEQYEKDLGIA